MFGTKILEFDNSDGTVESFNRIFSNTQLKDYSKNEQVEILGITEFNHGNLYLRDVLIGGKMHVFNFGEKNFVNPDYFAEGKTRFKYTARTLQGEVIAVAFNVKELAIKLGCRERVVDNVLLNKEIGPENKYLFTITRTDL